MTAPQITNRLIIPVIILSLLLPALAGMVFSVEQPEAEPTARGAQVRQNFFENETTIYDLDTNTDITIEGVAKWDSSGYTLALGDVDGDGYDDMVIGAYDAISGPADDRYSAGEVYVVYGNKKDSMPENIDLSKDADIIIYGIDENDHVGESLACGDINGDGKDDMLIGVPSADGPGNIFGSEDTGEVIVIYGRSRSNFPATFDLTKGTDINIYGVDSKDFAGSALAVGNINNDNYDDIIIGADHADGPSGKRAGTGDVYVFFGKSNLPNSLKCANADFKVHGNFWGDNLGTSIAVGDINNDNYDDMVIGAPNTFGGPNRNLTFNGEVYVILGNTQSNLGKTRDLDNLTYANMTIYGPDERDNLGSEVTVADLDADGFDDIIMGAVSGDGPNNARKNAGDVYILKGGTSLNKTVDLAISSNADLIIYGADPKDKAGESMAVGDMNGDGVSDLILGAAVGDGKANKLPSAGEAYVIFGNISFSSGTERDLGTTGADLIVYSTVENIHSGFDVAAGDIDNDGKDDIMLGAPFSDAKNGSIDGAGKTHVIYGTKVLKRLKNIGLRIDGVDDRSNPVCYSRYRSYSFVVNVTDSIGITDIEDVKLVLGPGNEDIELVWTELTNDFSKNNDPEGYIELLSTSDSKSAITDKLVELKFTVKFSGDFPDEGFRNVDVISTSSGGLTDTDTFEKVYSVENDLDYKGTLTVAGEFQGGLTSGSWIQSNESVEWSGLSVVYEGTDDKYPPNDYFEVFVEDDDGDKWSNSTSSGGPFSVITVADPDTDLSDFHTLWIESAFTIPNVPSPIQYETKVASPNITFQSPKPDSDVWFSTRTLNCSVTITDQSGGNVLGVTVQYAISTSGLFGFGLWQDAGISSNGISLTPEIAETFADGAENYIKWRAKSAIGTLGDIFSGSPAFRIKIDVTPVFFERSFPDELSWQPRLSVKCGITAGDHWTGVEANTIAYSYSKTGLNSFTNWISAGAVIDSGRINVEVLINFVEGFENYIKWRANDVIMNGLVESENYRVKVSTQKPISTLWLPGNASELSSTEPVLRWKSFDPNNDAVTYDIYVGTNRNLVENLDPIYRLTGGHMNDTFQTRGLSENTDYYWTVIPSDGVFTGICESGAWKFSIGEESQEPEVTLKLPLSNSILNETRVDLIWSAEHFSILDLEFQVYLDTSPIPVKLFKEVKSTFKVTLDENDIDEDVVYYWTVIPVHKNILGVSKSGIWNFSIDSSYTQHFNFTLDVNASQVSVGWNRSWQGYLELTNHGNGVDEVELDMYASGLENFVNVSVGKMTLQEGEVYNASVNISIPDGFPARSYNVIFQARSTISGERETHVLIIDVVGSVQYYRGYEEFDTPSETRPFLPPAVSEEISRMMRNIILIALTLVLIVAITVILVIKHSVNKANEKAIQRLKQLIVKRQKELMKTGPGRWDVGQSGSPKQTEVSQTERPAPAQAPVKAVEKPPEPHPHPQPQPPPIAQPQPQPVRQPQPAPEVPDIPMAIPAKPVEAPGGQDKKKEQDQ